MKKRILIFSTAYLPMLGGAEIAVKSITDNLATEDYQFDLLCARIDRRLPAIEQVGAVTVYRIGFGYSFDKLLLPFTALVWALILRSRKKYDCVWVIMASYASLAALVYCSLAPGAKMLLTIQEGDSRAHIERRMGVLKALFKAVFRRADAVQTISHYLAEWARAMGARSERIQVVPNGVDVGLFESLIDESDKRALRVALGIGAEEKIIITISRLVTKNGVDILLRACALMNLVPWKLLIVGEGSERVTLETLARKLGVENRVKFVRSISHSTLPRYLSVGDVFCRSSRSEGLGNVFLEAMAAGVPVVAPLVGGIKDFLVDNETGFVCGSGAPEDVAAALMRALNDTTVRERVVRAARVLVRKTYEWQHVSAHMKSIFDMLCAAPSSTFFHTAIGQQATAPHLAHESSHEYASHPARAQSQVHEPLTARTPLLQHILLAADIFPPESGGPATYVVQLANGLAERDVEVTVVSLDPASDKTVLDSRVHFFAVRSSLRKDVRGMARAYNKIVRYAEYLWLVYTHARAAQIIYAMGPVNAGLPALVASFFARAFFARGAVPRCVIKVVGDYAWEQGQVSGAITDSIDEFQKKSYRGKIGWLKKIESFVVRHADCVIVPSRYLQSMVEGWGAPDNTIQVIMNAVEHKEINSHTKPVGEQWIVSVGRLVPWKGMDTLIEIMQDILKLVPRAKLKIIGDGPEREKLASHVRDRNLQEAVELLGNLSHDATLRYIKSADVFVLNSGYEGLSHVILEVLSLGTPVIASRSGGNVEVLTSECLFEYNNKNEICKKIIQMLQGVEREALRGLTERDGASTSENPSMIDETQKILEQICVN